ncbi:MAG: TRAP transporter small permease, partial [Deltaproteobacteria bacterium]|nr:TRAP transporter small permease [Deltaproteobacteria bacterium]
MKRDLSRWMELAERGFLTVGVMVSIIISGIGVFYRYALHNSLSWVEGIAGFLLVGIIAVGISAAAKKGINIRVDILPQSFPKSKRVWDFIADVAGLGIMTILFILSIQFIFVMFNNSQKTTSLPWLPLWLPLIIMPLGFMMA